MWLDPGEIVVLAISLIAGILWALWGRKLP
mgnify:CR=1 FL=1